MSIADYVGKEGAYVVDGFTIAVKVDDVKQAFGRTDVHIVPAGTGVSGGKWVDAEKVKFKGGR